MNWKKASEELPLEKEEVLIKCGGTFLLATYDYRSAIFIDKLGAACTYPLSKILWSRMEEKEKK